MKNENIYVGLYLFSGTYDYQTCQEIWDSVCVVQTLIMVVVLLRSLQNKSHRGQPGGFEEEVGGRRKKGWPFFRKGAAFRRSLCFYGRGGAERSCAAFSTAIAQNTLCPCTIQAAVQVL